MSAGAFGTPHLLLNSGIGDKKELEAVKVKAIHHLPEVGKGLSDHLTFPVGWSANGVVRPVDYPAALEEWQTNRTGPLTEAVGHQVMFARIPPNAPLFKEHRDPASGPNAPHLEITLAVGPSRFVWVNSFCILTPFQSQGPQVGAYIVLLTPKSRSSCTLPLVR